MAFKFRLQSVLDHREHLEEKAKAVYGARLKVEQECALHIQWLEGEVVRAREHLATREKQGVAGYEFAQVGDYVSVLRMQIQREQMRLRGLKVQTEKARLKLVEATRERKVMEVLKERHLEQYQREQRLIEQKGLDEIAVQGYARRHSQ